MTRPLMRSEIQEQPAALARLLGAEGEIASLAAIIRRKRPRLVRFVAHGSSDNAASFGVYAFGLLPGWSAMRDSISLSVYYEADLDFSDSLVIALSQSGQTPDVVAYAARARARGAFVVALTNDPVSDLATAANATIPLSAGREQSVAATKTYVNQLAALVLLAGFIAGNGPEVIDWVRRTADQIAEAIESLDRAASLAAEALASTDRMFVTGRGLEYATAREIALKLTETCRIAAEPLTTTALSHGPVTAVNPLFPVWLILSRDASLPSAIAAADAARAAGGTIVASGEAAPDIEASIRLTTPKPVSPLVAPLLSVVPGQLVACALAQIKGFDPDRPTHLQKVTLAL